MSTIRAHVERAAPGGVAWGILFLRYPLALKISPFLLESGRDNEMFQILPKRNMVLRMQEHKGDERDEQNTT